MLRLFVVLCFLSGFLFACSGACLECHPSLLKNGKYDKDHEILATCASCHENHEQKEGSKCGADCWECHSIKEVSESNIIEHKNLRYCAPCHLKLNISKASPSSSLYRNGDTFGNFKEIFKEKQK
ncbi:MAG: hypothetical protein PHN38_07475 [Sulfurospirillaceae bacterium]|nr:hypothetical protein [Sulfurospirillaceae bacterium]MDD3463580.1 hypothetical protein [Sulfurospirillaceae bacterium]